MKPLIFKVIATLILFAVGALAVHGTLYHLENPTTEFATYEEMINSPLMQAGWLPTVLPLSAYDISETHNLDTNAVQIIFRYTPGDTGVAENKCQLTGARDNWSVFRCDKGQLILSKDGDGTYSE